MSYIFRFPDLGEGLTEGKLLEWYIEEGQVVKEGDLLAKVETDKVVADIPAPRAGTILRRHGALEEILIVGNPFVEIGAKGESPTPEPPKLPPAPAPESGPGVVGNIEVATGSEVMPASGEGLGAAAAGPTLAEPRTRALASPLARRMAADFGLEIHRLTGTGPSGRVMKADVLRAREVAPVAPTTQAAVPVSGASSAPAMPRTPAAPLPPRGSSRSEALSQLRKTIAARMVASKFSAPHATTFEEVEVSRLVALRETHKNRWAEEGLKLSYMPFVCKAVAAALRRHPKLNCRLDMEQSQVTWQHFVHLGVAVDTPEGLIVPVIRDADTLSVKQLAAAIADLAARARSRQIKLEELKGGTFTITNYGAIAGIYGAPIINAPEAAILGVGRLLETPVVRDGAVVPGRVLPLSLAVDHRIVDGGDAARFLRDVLDQLADPVGMLLE
jgi:pyruvate dehydrogenase E2 component (dihydrolipoamide acetyltransferase)